MEFIKFFGVNSVSAKILGILCYVAYFKINRRHLHFHNKMKKEMEWNATKSMEGSCLSQFEVTVGEMFCRTCGDDEDIELRRPCALQNLWG